jgi:Trk K+ transport system NAD-binding subunit
MRAPDSDRLLSWLTGPPGSYLPPRVPTPPGRWVVCGYGRFGAEVVRAIQAGGFDVTIVDPDQPPTPGLRLVLGYGTDEATLQEAGIAEADGLVAGSDDDTANLAMAMAARKLKPSIFVILRQNLARNRSLFRAFHAEMTMVPSEIIAHECLAILRTPHLSAFLALVHARDNAWAESVTARLEPIVGHGSPDFWSVALDPSAAGGLLDAVDRTGTPATLRGLTRDPADRRDSLPCTALLLVRGGALTELPAEATELRSGDELLFAGRDRARRTMLQTLLNANAAELALTGHDPAASLLGRLLGDRARATDGPQPP